MNRTISRSAPSDDGIPNRVGALHHLLGGLVHYLRLAVVRRIRLDLSSTFRRFTLSLWRKLTNFFRESGEVLSRSINVTCEKSH